MVVWHKRCTETRDLVSNRYDVYIIAANFHAENKWLFILIEVLTSVPMSTIIWDVTPYSPVVHRRFGGTCLFFFFRIEDTLSKQRSESTHLLFSEHETGLFRAHTVRSFLVPLPQPFPHFIPRPTPSALTYNTSSSPGPLIPPIRHSWH
jgi:hypothetical protein